MKFFKIITINLLLIFLIYNLIIFVMIGASEIYTIHQDRKITKDENSICIRYSCFKNYENISWAALHYREYSQIKFHYETPVVWRANKFDGKTINISGKYNSRLTLSNLSDEDLIKKKHIFLVDL